jgi:hypothetical protein
MNTMLRRHAAAAGHCAGERRGAVTMEAVLAVGILLLLVIAAVELNILVTVQNAVAHAAIKAAREAGKGADITEVAEVVEVVLEPHGIVIGDNASVILEDAGTRSEQSRGDLPCVPPASPELDSEYVRVSVCVSLGAIPFLEYLDGFGLGFLNQMLRASAAVKKECPGAVEYTSEPAP